MNSSDLPLWPRGEAPNAASCETSERATVLAQYGLDALQDDPELSRITRFAAQLCEVPTALVSLVEEERQRFIAREGLDALETPRSASFCAHTMLRPDPLIVPDTHDHPDFADNPLVVGDPFIRFYAGAPLVSAEGMPLGSLCVVDSEPRPGGLTPLQLEGLQTLASAVMRRLLSRRIGLDAARQEARDAKRLQLVLDAVPDIAWSADADLNFDFFNAQWEKQTGKPAPVDVDGWEEFIHPDDFPRTQEKIQQMVEGEARLQDEWRLKTADGSWRWMLARAVQMPGSDGTTRWFGTITDIDDAHQASQAHEVLSRELSHRIKNIFAVVSGLVAMSVRRHPDAKDFGGELIEKIRALGRAHDFVRPVEDQRAANLHGLLEQLFAPYTIGGKAQVKVSGLDLDVTPRAATPLALVFHELATNSAKYGLLAQESGSISLEIAQAGETLVMEWSEPGVDAPEDVPLGFGSQLLTMSVEGQLRGKIDREWTADGLTVRLMVPQPSITG